MARPPRRVRAARGRPALPSARLPLSSLPRVLPPHSTTRFRVHDFMKGFSAKESYEATWDLSRSLPLPADFTSWACNSEHFLCRAPGSAAHGKGRMGRQV